MARRSSMALVVLMVNGWQNREESCCLGEDDGKSTMLLGRSLIGVISALASCSGECAEASMLCSGYSGLNDQGFGLDVPSDVSTLSPIPSPVSIFNNNNNNNNTMQFARSIPDSSSKIHRKAHSNGQVVS